MFGWAHLSQMARATIVAGAIVALVWAGFIAFMLMPG